MQKILVTTDFSNNSKRGLRFAMQLASQKDFELVFFHCFQAMIPTSIHRERIEGALQEQVKDHLHKLEKFVASVLKPMGVKVGKYRCVVVEDLSPERAILDYVEQKGMDYICISTRGAGNLMKIIGTNTSKILVKSPVPVMVVPHNYRLCPLKSMLYASDLENFDLEMPKVSAFAKSVGAKVDLLHFYYNEEVKLDTHTLAGMWQQKYQPLEKVMIKPFGLELTFAEQLKKEVTKTKPGLVVFFTQTNLTWFAKLFSPNRSEAFSFVTNVPMLVYRKE